MRPDNRLGQNVNNHGVAFRLIVRLIIYNNRLYHLTKNPTNTSGDVLRHLTWCAKHFWRSVKEKVKKIK